MNRSSLPLNIGKLKKYWDSEEGILKCDLPFQRQPGVWNAGAKSSLVWSIMNDSYIPPVVLLKDRMGTDEKGKEIFCYNILDGQQRLTSIFSFMDDEWVLHTDTPAVAVDGFEYDLSGRRFSELEEELKNAITQFRFSAQCLEDYTMEEAEALYFNINSGVSLSSVQKSKPRMGTELSRFFASLLEGDFFARAVNITEAQAKREDNLLMLIQSALLLDDRHAGVGYKTISAAFCFSYAECMRDTYSPERKAVLAGAVGYLDSAFQSKNKFLRKNNVPVVAVMADVALGQGIAADDFRSFINEFASRVYPSYDAASGSGNVKYRLVQMRLRVMFLAFCRYFGLDAEAVGKPFAEDIPLYEGITEADGLLGERDSYRMAD